MGKTVAALTDVHSQFIRSQNMFFVATAPLDTQGHINVSPKGLDSFRILGPTTVAYLDLTGSGVETIAHLRENGRIVIMFCAFQGPPNILRLHGRGRSVNPEDTKFQSLQEHFPVFASTRSIVVVEISRVSDSCGYGVPLLQYEGERSQLQAWARKKGPNGLKIYREERIVKVSTVYLALIEGGFYCGRIGAQVATVILAWAVGPASEAGRMAARCCSWIECGEVRMPEILRCAWRFLGSGIVLLFLCAAAPAQYGKARTGYFPPTYYGATFTGTVQATSPTSITLTYTHGDKTDTFVGYAAAPCSLAVTKTDVKPVPMSSIPENSVVTVFYQSETEKIDGKKEKRNGVVALSFLEFNGKSIDRDKRAIFYCTSTAQLTFRSFF